MSTESLRHCLIASRTLVALYRRLDAGGFEAARGKLKILANGQDRYPDIVVFPQSGEMDSDTIPNPVVVVEVVSRASGLVDRFEKNVDYAATPSVQHYVMLSDERRAAVVCSRTGDGWASVELEQSGIIVLPAIGVDLPLDDIYRRIDFGASRA